MNIAIPNWIKFNLNHNRNPQTPRVTLQRKIDDTPESQDDRVAAVRKTPEVMKQTEAIKNDGTLEVAFGAGSQMNESSKSPYQHET